MATILCAGVHEGLVHTRRLILEGAGHVVVTAMSSPEIITACQKFKFNVAVIGHSSDPNTKREWATLVQKHCPSTKILEIVLPHHDPSISSADAWLEAPAIPEQLAERVKELGSETERHHKH